MTTDGQVKVRIRKVKVSERKEFLLFS